METVIIKFKPPQSVSASHFYVDDLVQITHVHNVHNPNPNPNADKAFSLFSIASKSRSAVVLCVQFAKPSEENK